MGGTELLAIGLFGLLALLLLALVLHVVKDVWAARRADKAEK